MKKAIIFLSFIFASCSNPQFEYQLINGGTTKDYSLFLADLNSYEQCQKSNIEYNQMIGKIDEYEANIESLKIESKVELWKIKQRERRELFINGFIDTVK